MTSTAAAAAHRCRTCGKPCLGTRCRLHFTLAGRIQWLLRQAGQDGLTEERIAAWLSIESELRRLEKRGEIHERDGKWRIGPYPEETS